MNRPEKSVTIGEYLDAKGISRRSFLKFCTINASLMALPPGTGQVMAAQLRAMKRPSVIYLSFQECTGCLESLSRSFSPSVESLIFDVISLDYDDTLMAAAGHQAEQARENAMRENWGKYVIVVDGSVPTANGGVYCTAAGKTAEAILTETAEGAAAIVAVGTCSSYGGLPKASPNPTGALPVSKIITDKPVINIPGCPPIAEVITGTLLHFLTLGVPDLDAHGRPTAFYGNAIHDRCYRRPFYDQGKFAKSFDDAGARSGWCLYELGCKGPLTYNACATVKWNDGISFPIESGHGCLGCSEPDFWDKGGFYQPIPEATFTDTEKIALAAAAGAALGAGSAVLSRWRRKKKLAEAAAGEEAS
ncbi:MAG: hydrogenase small subunit [Gammaproteobacteria bacterium]|nr:hydrogenase small subunit [Gammaproteobacteria bacterium]